MSVKTTPVFIVGTGRSGSRTFFRMLSGAPEIDIHHEYAVHQTQRLAALYFMRQIESSYVKQKIGEMHGAAIHYSHAKTWIDSSNKLSWLIDPLSKQFPESRFLAVIRDGRKVVSSFYYKLREEMYDDDSTMMLQKWLDNTKSAMPPAEKPIWWNIPQNGQPWREEFPTFNRLQRVAYHWAECNRVILESFSSISSDRVKIVKLEELRQDSSLLEETLSFLGVPMDESYISYLQTPRNVFLPLDFQLTKGQLSLFNEICEPMMQTFGYDQKECYSVKY
jgi:hypothetical protein